MSNNLFTRRTISTLIMKDPIVEEVRKARSQYARQFNFDLHAICKDLKQKEEKCGHPIKSLPAKLVLKSISS